MQAYRPVCGHTSLWALLPVAIGVVGALWGDDPIRYRTLLVVAGVSLLLPYSVIALRGGF